MKICLILVTRINSGDLIFNLNLLYSASISMTEDMRHRIDEIVGYLNTFAGRRDLIDLPVYVGEDTHSTFDTYTSSKKK